MNRRYSWVRLWRTLPAPARLVVALIALIVSAAVVLTAVVQAVVGPGDAAPASASVAAGASRAEATASAAQSAGVASTSPLSSPADGSSQAASATDGTAAALLETLPVKGRAPKTGYDRVVVFGSSWMDVDDNGCDTRNDILARDLTEVSRSGECKVLSGTLVSAYSGATVNFVRGASTSAAVQIDHLVALSNAWQTGAQQISQAQREALANDPLNLQAVEGALNQQKSDSDAASWLPPLKSYRCEYVARQISVKAAYGLWVTQAEHDAMVDVLASCPGQVAYASGLAAR